MVDREVDSCTTTTTSNRSIHTMRRVFLKVLKTWLGDVVGDDPFSWKFDCVYGGSFHPKY